MQCTHFNIIELHTTSTTLSSKLTSIVHVFSRPAWLIVRVNRNFYLTDVPLRQTPENQHTVTFRYCETTVPAKKKSPFSLMSPGAASVRKKKEATNCGAEALVPHTLKKFPSLCFCSYPCKLSDVQKLRSSGVRTEMP